MNHMKLIKLIILVAVLCFSTVMAWVIGGVIYWWQVFPVESVILKQQGSGDIFAGLRGPVSDNNQDVLYSETLSPLLLYGLGLPTAECSSTALRRGRLNLANPLVMYMRSKGMHVAYCKGNKGTCWIVDSVLSSVALRMKYSTNALKELYLILYDFKSVDNTFQYVLGHSLRDVSPEEAAVISRWVAGPVFVKNNPHTVESIQKESEIIALSCRKPYVPATSAEIGKLLSAIQDCHGPRLITNTECAHN